MSWRRDLCGCVVLSCLVANVLASAAWGQIRAMPLNTVKNSFPLLDDGPDIDRAPDNNGAEASPSVVTSDSGDIILRTGYLDGEAVAPAGPPMDQPSDLAEEHTVVSQQPTFTVDDSQFLNMAVESSGPRVFPPGLSGNWWSWQMFPDGLIYRSYMAGGRESRFAAHWVHERDRGWLWDVTLGGRMGLLRYGTQNDAWPEGWQLDIEGAAFPRLSLERSRDMDATDFRLGVPLTFRRGVWEGKLAYYHLSSHLGDEFIETFGRPRINFVRDAIVLGIAVWPCPDMRLYSEAGWAFRARGGSEPWEFQFGIDWSSPEPTGRCGGPFFAVNCRLRQEVGFGGNMTVQNGWQWRGRSGHLMRIGMQYFHGQSDQYQFFTEHEEQIGVGLWYDY